MLDLLAPLGLAALGTLIIPVLIHLVRRSERKLVDFAALRWLSDRSRLRKQVRLHERGLLVLRLLLLATVAILLALPVWRIAEEAGKPWLVVASGTRADEVQRLAGVRSDAEIHDLNPDFDRFNQSPNPNEASSTSLIRELDSIAPAKTSLTIVVPKTLYRVDGERLRLRHAVSWVVTPDSADFFGSVRPQPEHLKISVRHDEAGRAELPLVRAIAQAWSVDGPSAALDIGGVDAPLPAEADVLFWLAGPPTDALMRWIGNGNVAVVSRGHDAGNAPSQDDGTSDQAALPREQIVGEGLLLRLPGPLTLDALPIAAEPEFPERLRRILFRPDVPTAVKAETFAPSQSAIASPLPAKSLKEWLALVAGLLFLIERFVATGARRVAE